MKKIYLLAAAAALFAACSSDKDSLETQQQPAQLEEGAVGFDVYLQRATTRGGWAGALTTAKLQDYDATDDTKAGHYGFGVFGYYTDNNEYDQRSTPNFFYNQQVTYQGGSWVYEPVKYWPNEYGTNAVSEDQDKVTYFAYAPWIEVIPTSGKLADTTKEAEEWGITGMTRNSNQGDPILKYIASFNSTRSVDLCWGVADNNDGIWPITQGGKTLSYENGLPWIDVERPANTNQRVKFTFKHALAQMQVNIDAFVDGTDATNALSPKTRIWVREVTFKGFAMKGALNLHNEDKNEPKWLDYGGQNELVAEGVTIYDGRKDGKEGVNGAIATNEKVTGLNPILVQDGLYEGVGDDNAYKSSTLNVYGVNENGVLQTGESEYNRAGVTNNTVDLFAQNLTNANTISGKSLFHVIPTDEEVEVEIVYDVETVSENLAQNLSDGATKGSSIENRITKHITFGTTNGTTESKLEAGHSYTLNLHLGMNSVKFDAAVTDWIDVQEQDIDLPLNVPAFPMNNGTKDIELPYKGDYTFALTGLNGGESMTTDFAGSDNEVAVAPQTEKWKFTVNNANTSGIAIQTVTTQVNPTTKNRTQTVTWTGNQSGLKETFNFKQDAHPLNLKISSMGGTTITLQRDAEFTQTDDWLCAGTDVNAAKIIVWRNGTELEHTTAEPAAGQFKFVNENDATTATITLADALQAKDVIKVELTTGDAPTETVTGVVEGTFGYYPAERTIPYKSTAYTDILPSYAKSSSITYSEDSDDDNIVTLESDGSFTTSGVNSSSKVVKIKANDGSTDALLTLTVVKQDSEIKNFDNQSVPKKTTEVAAGGNFIATLAATCQGKLETSNNGTVSYDIVEQSSGDYFIITGTNRLGTKASTTVPAGTYTVKIKATGTLSSGNDAKFNAPEEKTAIYTITVTD